MEAVDILGGIDRQQHMRGIDVPGQRQLHQDAVDRGIGIQCRDQRQQLGLGGLGRQPVIEARHAEFGGELALAADIDLTRGIRADQNRCETGLRRA